MIALLKRTDAEWRQESWTLLGNRKQLERNDWTHTGMILGGAWGVRSILRFPKPSRDAGLVLLHLFGGMGLGSIVGTAAFMEWRHGIKTVTFDEEL
jgi:hypothetical protein